ncbi:MAG: flagellar biosynthesis anti-sigma factor FlgM [Caldimonas sp.]
MKIGHPANKPPVTPAAGTPAAAGDVAKTTPTPRHATTTAPAADASATVALSSAASTLLSSGSTPEFDAAKVAQISGAIANNSFKVDHAAIADKLIANAQELLGKVKG